MISKNIPILEFSSNLNLVDEIKSILQKNEFILIKNLDFENYQKTCRSLGKLNDRYGEFYEVIDSGIDYKSTNIPISQTREDTGVHTDSSAKVFNPNYVSLFCHNQGMAGGDSYFVDMRLVFEIMRKNDSGLIEYLCRDFYRDVITPGDINNIENIKKNKFPIIKIMDGHLSQFRYMRYWIERAYEKLNVQNELDKKMLDRLDEYLIDSQFRFQFKLNCHEAVIFNNNYFPHGRTQYLEDPINKRRLTRVWFESIEF